MARICKKGLVYFPLEVEFFNDRKIRRLNLRTNSIGSVIYLFILTMIYRNSYYIETTAEDLCDDIASSFPDKEIFSVSKINEVIDMCIFLELFDPQLAQQGIFTSRGIQKQYMLSTKRRKEIEVSKYWLLDSEDMVEVKLKIQSSGKQDESNLLIEENSCRHNVCNNDKNADNHSVETNYGSHHAYQSTQSKSKRESKRKKDKKDRIDKTNLYGFPKIHYLTEVLIQNKYIDEWCLDIPKYNALFEELTKSYDFSDICIATNYLLQYARRADPPIDFPYAFFSSSIVKALEQYREDLSHSDESFEEWVSRNF